MVLSQQLQMNNKQFTKQQLKENCVCEVHLLCSFYLDLIDH